jgi:hypothetical protein
MKNHAIITIILIIALCLSITGCTEQNQSTTSIDTDGDGYTDDIDAFPTNATEWTDTDNDGIGDNTDAFPQNDTEWKDTDNDGIGDNTDYYPYDDTRWKTPETILINKHHTTHTINTTTQEIKLIITATNCTIIINKHTQLIELLIQGDNNTINLSINHSFTLDNTGKNNELIYYDEVDPIIQQALPYLQKINSNNNDLQDYAQGIISGCSPNNKECQLTALYRYIIQNYELNTTNPHQNIQTPQETIQKKSGTHNDLTILLNSLLENININTYLTIIDDHIYTFVPTIDPEKIWVYTESSLIDQVETEWGEPIIQTYQDSFTIDSLNVWYYGGDQESTFGSYIDELTISYTINSDYALHFFIVHTYNDFINLTQGQPFNHYTDYEKTALIGIINTIQIPTYGGLVFLNEGLQTANVTVDFEFSFHPSFYNRYSKENITEYTFDSSSGILMDVSLGTYGFPGYDKTLIGEKTIISIATKEYHTIS